MMTTSFDLVYLEIEGICEKGSYVQKKDRKIYKIIIHFGELGRGPIVFFF